MNPVARKAAQTVVKANVWLYRRTNGRVAGRGLGRLPLLLLTVPGRNSGTPRTVPIAYLDHERGYLLVGTGMGGSRAIPQWFLNLQAAGKGCIQIGGQEHDVDAHLASNIERDALWPLIAGRAPHFARWQARTGRSLPVIVLTVRSSSGLAPRPRKIARDVRRTGS